MTDPSRVPVVVAGAQVTNRGGPLRTMALIEQAAAAALAGAPGIDRRVQLVSVVNVMSPVGPSPATRLAARLRLASARAETTAIGGNTPVWLLLRAAAAVAAGELDAALVAGGETMASGRRIRGGEPLAADDGPGAALDPGESAPVDAIVGDDRAGMGPAESAIGLLAPSQVYPLFESALAAGAGRTWAGQRAECARVLAPFTAVAATQPEAWFREASTADALADPSGGNRISSEPYTKRMNAFLNVDQAAAFVVTSAAVAAELGLADQALPVWAGATVNDVWLVPERPDLASSPAIAAAAGAAFDAAGIGVDDVAAFDLYSCFPCAVQMAAAALGVAPDDARGLTVTGGLPYFGGPGNNYPTHAVVAMRERLLDTGGGLGLVTGVGWYVTKNSLVVIGTSPPPGGFRMPDVAGAQAAIDATAVPVVAGGDPDLAGAATVVASTVLYRRDGSAEGAPVVATLEDGRRVVAKAHPDDLTAIAAIGAPLVGRRVHVAGAPPVYRLLG